MVCCAIKLMEGDVNTDLGIYLTTTARPCRVRYTSLRVGQAEKAAEWGVLRRVGILLSNGSTFGKECMHVSICTAVPAGTCPGHQAINAQAGPTLG